MSNQVPASHQYLLKDETKAFAFIATVTADGSPHVTPVWFNEKDGLIWINSAAGRVKDKNMRARPRVAVAIMDPDEPEEYMQLRGEVVEITTEGAAEHLHELSRKYRGADFNIPEGQVRTIYKIQPDKVNTM